MIKTKQFLKHMKQWIFSCPIWQWITIKDYHCWIGHCGDGNSFCLVCDATKFDPEDGDDLSNMENSTEEITLE